MRKIIIFVILSVGALAFFLLNTKLKETSVSQNRVATKSNMKITSSAFSHNSKIPSKYTCDGENINPPLQFVDVPSSAKSLALIVDDPDAPAKTWVHWVVYNIDPQTSEVKENSIPQGGIEGTTDFGKPGYGGPCPPSGVHRYFFKLYALDSALDLPQKAGKQIVEEKMKEHIIDQTELIGLYSRN